MRDHKKFYTNAAPLNYGDLAMVCRAFGYKITPDDLFEMAQHSLAHTAWNKLQAAQEDSQHTDPVTITK